MTNQNLLVFLRKLIPKQRALFELLEGKGFVFDDSKVNLDLNADTKQIPVQRAIEALDTHLSFLATSIRPKLIEPIKITIAADSDEADFSEEARWGSPSMGKSHFSEIKAAIRYLEELDLNGQDVDIEIGDGDYTSEGLIHLPALVSPKAETCWEEDPEPESALDIINAEVRIYGADNATQVLVAGWELDRHCFYSIGNMTIVGSDTGQEGIFAKRKSILALHDLKFDGSFLEQAGAIEADDSFIYLLGSNVFNCQSSSLFNLSNHSTLSTIGEVNIAYQANIDCEYLATVADSIFDFESVTISDPVGSGV